jgi:ABC-type nitrate/sulfonate/bicarbonate transport system permease component
VLSAVGVLVVLLGAWYGASVALAAAGKGFLLPLPHEMITRGFSDPQSVALFAGILAVCLLGAATVALVERLSRVAVGRRDDSPR